MSILHNVAQTSNRLQLQRAWYNTYQLQEYWIKKLHMKETGFLSPSWTTDRCNKRMQRCHTTQDFQAAIHYSPINDCSKLNNIYYSLATFKIPIPLFRKDQEKEKQNYKKLIWQDFESFDIVLDIDAPDHAHIQIAFEDMQRIHQDLKKKGTKHYIRFSGKGFHIFLLPTMKPLTQASFDPEYPDNIYKQMAMLAKDYYDRYTELIDLKIYDHRRVIKLPFSLVHYEKETYICTPLRRIEVEEWKTFKLELFEVKTFLNNHPSFPEYIPEDHIFE